MSYKVLGIENSTATARSHNRAFVRIARNHYCQLQKSEVARDLVMLMAFDLGRSWYLVSVVFV